MNKLYRCWRWVVYFWWAKVRRKPESVCPPNCPLCAVQVRTNAHYDGCEVCQGAGFPCETMKALQVEEDAATELLMEGRTTNGSSVPAIVLPPWDWSKK